MDVAQSWSKTTGKITAAREVAAAGAVSAADALTPVCAPAAAWWDAEADRREQLRSPDHLTALIDAQRAHAAARSLAARTRAQRVKAGKDSTNPLSAARRAARAADKAARQARNAATVELRAARRDYPDTLTSVAIKAHAAHLVPAGLACYAVSTPVDWTLWPGVLSAGLVAVNAGVLWLGRRQALTAVVDGSVSVEERQLMERLDPAFWVAHAPERGLGGTVTTPPTLEAGGIRCEIRLDGTWTVKTLVEKTDSVRALLGARTALRMRIGSAARGGWAVLTLATRSAAADVSALWTPDRIPADPTMMSLGLDIETGEEVLIPFAERLLVSGASGTGKSWSARPLMATAHLRGDLALIDGKGEESIPWDGVCRTANEPGEIDTVIDETHRTMVSRKTTMKHQGISVWDGRQLTLVIDEGQVVLARILRDKDRLQRLVELSSLGRSRGVVLWWATQYPVTDGSAPGVHKMIGPNLLTRFSLRVAGTTQSQVALDDCAHYAPHQIPTGPDYRGHGYLKGYGPRMIRSWTLDDAGVRALPRSIWHGHTSTLETEPKRPGLRLVSPPDSDKTSTSEQVEPATGEITDSERVVITTLLAATQPQRHRDLTAATGMAKATVSKALGKLAERGLVTRDGHTYTASRGAGEVSA